MKKSILLSALSFTLLLTNKAQGDLQWLQQISEVNDDIDIHQMNIDAAGNVYVGGSFDDQVLPQANFSGVSERSLDEQNGFLAKYNPSGDRLWINKFGSSNSTTGYSPLAMIENNGFLYVAGTYKQISGSGLDFDPGAGSTPYQYTSTGTSTDFFISKYNTSDGSIVWAYVGGGSSGSDLPRGITIDNNNNIYVTGYVNNGSGDVNFDIKNGNTTNATGINGKKHLYIAKYDTDCNFIWRNNILNSSDISGGALTYDAVNDYVYLTGGIGEDSGGQPKFPSTNGGLSTLNVNDADDGYIAKYNTSGDLQWVKNVAEGLLSNYFWSIDTDNAGNVYLGGVMQGTVDFNPSGTRSLTSAGSKDASFAKYDATGAHQWSYIMGSTSFGEECREIRVNSIGNIVISGGMYGAANYNPEGTGSPEIKGVNGSRYIYFGEYDTDFKYQWAHAIGGASTGNNYANAAAIDENDPLNPFYVWGYIGKGTTEDFDPNNTTGDYTATGTEDNGFLAKYSTNLNPLPIVLVSFDANLKNTSVELNWLTESEINNDYFTIQKSKNTIDWYDVLTREGAGNSNSPISYHNTDNQPIKGHSYYRLKQTDFNGVSSYSNIKPIQFIENLAIEVTYSQGKIKLLDNKKSPLNVMITNSLGEVLFNEKDINSSYIDISNYSTGLYIITLYNDRKMVLSQKILKY